MGGILLAAQLLLLFVYVHLNEQRTDDGGQHPELSTAPPLRDSREFPAVTVEARQGKQVSLDRAKPTLVHVWATWCPPCRAELPGLLALDGDKLHVVAIALDPDWETLDRFFEGEIPVQVVRGDPDELRAALAIQTLPVTFLVDGESSHALRFDGARDWGSKDFQQRWLSSD